MVEGLIWLFSWHLDAFLLSIALERVTIERIMPALVAVAAAAPRSTAKTSWNICRGMATSTI